MILPGSPVRTDNVELLASVLDGDELAVKLERAVPNENSLVALSSDDRRRAHSGSQREGLQRVIDHPCRAVCQSLVRGIPVRMIVNGVSVEDDLVLALAGVVNNPALAHKLQTAHRFRSGVINLSNAERTLVLAALDDPSAELEELRAHLDHLARRWSTRIG